MPTNSFKAQSKSLLDHLDMITQKVFRQMKDPKHPLHDLISPIEVSHSPMVLLPTYPYQLPLSKTVHYKRDIVPLSI